jgi:2-keto-4-pentenoate hydratase/2-oxohepta-3-ene-1,7-dioic acid hydratase in catechol pathway
MRLATLRTAGGTRVVRVDDDGYVDLRLPDVGSVLRRPDWAAYAAGAEATCCATAVDLAPVVTAPGKIICAGHDYRTHIPEMGRELPTYPTQFAKYTEALTRANDPIRLPPESDADWEAKLALAIGRSALANAEEAALAIAGFTVINDVTIRNSQHKNALDGCAARKARRLVSGKRDDESYQWPAGGVRCGRGCRPALVVPSDDFRPSGPRTSLTCCPPRRRRQPDRSAAAHSRCSKPRAC